MLGAVISAGSSISAPAGSYISLPPRSSARTSTAKVQSDMRCTKLSTKLALGLHGKKHAEQRNWAGGA